VIKIVSWNVHQLDLLDDVADADVVLLQECPGSAGQHPGWTVFPAEDEWSTGASAWRTAIAVRDGSGWEAQPIVLSSLHDADGDSLGVSRSGTLTAARISGPGHDPFVAISAYARWETAHGDSTIYADANAHRILSDISVFLTHSAPAMDVVIAGDWNLLLGYNEDPWPEYWKIRYDTVFDRARALGLDYLGPRTPNGRQADPWPRELPSDSTCVPTFHSNRQTPATAARQLDHVFVTRRMARNTRATALNEPAAWGRSDHCRILIEIGGDLG